MDYVAYLERRTQRAENYAKGLALKLDEVIEAMNAVETLLDGVKVERATRVDGKPAVEVVVFHSSALNKVQGPEEVSHD